MWKAVVFVPDVQTQVSREGKVGAKEGRARKSETREGELEPTRIGWMHTGLSLLPSFHLAGRRGPAIEAGPLHYRATHIPPRSQRS